MREIVERRMDWGEYVPEPDDGLIVCRCEEITKGEIRKAIHDGMYTMTEIRRYLRVGMGLCQGNTCGRIVKGMIAEEMHKAPSSIADCTARGPARPVEIRTFAQEVNRDE